jgi:ElaB/YqjD/DUF883 family membrane-anchored ribosome-binding protein
MGKDPAELDRQIEQQRQQITRRLDDLQGRIRKDVSSVRDEAKGRASNMAGEAKTYVDFQTQMRERPALTMAGALGVGVLLGVLSESLTASDSSYTGAPRYAYEPPARPSALTSAFNDLAGSIFGPATSTFRDELRDLVQEGFTSVKRSLKGEGTEGDRPDLNMQPQDESLVEGSRH